MCMCDGACGLRQRARCLKVVCYDAWLRNSTTHDDGARTKLKVSMKRRLKYTWSKMATFAGGEHTASAPVLATAFKMGINSQGGQGMLGRRQARDGNTWRWVCVTRSRSLRFGAPKRECACHA